MPPRAVRSQHILVKRVGREQCSGLPLQESPWTAEVHSSWFYCHALAFTDFQQNEVSSSAGASAGDSSFCSQQLLLTAASAHRNFCSQQLLPPAVGLEGAVRPHPGQGHCGNPLQTSNICPGRVSDPFMNHLGKGVRIALIACCRGVKKVLAFPLEGLKYNDFHCWQGCCRN